MLVCPAGVLPGVRLCMDEPDYVGFSGIPRPDGGAGHILRYAQLECVVGAHQG